MGIPIEDRVAEHCRRHGLLPARARVLALVSGGPDSTCLMHLLAALTPGRVGVLAVDHGLRAEGREEARAVRSAAGALGLPAHVQSAGLAPGPGAQERAREARRALALGVADAHGYDLIATGHTASDQAETVLFRLARGAGRAGALGMAPRDGRWVRPLLCVSGEETRSWCAERGIAVALDPSNADPAYARARARHGLLPALRSVHPGAEAHVAAFAERLRDEAEILEPLVSAAWERVAEGEGLLTGALLAEPEPMRRLLVRRLISRAGLPGDAAGAAAVRRALDAAAAGSRASLPGGGGVAVERGRLVAVGPPSPAPSPVPLPVPGAARFGGVTLRAEAGVGARPAPDRVAVAVEGPLVVRSPRPGDRLPLPSGEGRRAVGRLLADAGVPARLRPQVPVVATPERVVWVAGHRAAPDLLAPEGAPALVLALERA